MVLPPSYALLTLYVGELDGAPIPLQHAVGIRLGMQVQRLDMGRHRGASLETLSSSAPGLPVLKE